MMDGASEQSRRVEGALGHISVMEREVVRLVTAQAVEQGRPLRCVDLTLGLAGHARAVAEILPAGSQVIGFDRDPAALERAKARMSEPGIEGIQTLFIQASFAEAEECLRARGMVPVDFVLFDLGLNSTQLDAGERGFSLMSSGPLDMRMDPEGGGVTAGDLLNTLDAERLADIFWLLGEERYSRRIARALVKGRPWQSTLEVAEAISRAVGGRKGAKIHPATRCFQALRMAVNDELGAIRAGLPAAGRILRAGGVMAVISFHSLEHRLVKTFFRAGARRCLCPEEQPVCTCRFEPIFRWEQRREQRP
ncbi:MAG TPA: 16S rRNA (cytosine(1402)-N(4))-methyltransferase, partial [Verrucomicrobia bacterium]|nr:16S rRNA (cytosine(1402)-N(4))-methyltransferase [Verrucomicrobiota bacterium]